MSDPTATPFEGALPPLEIYPERGESPDGWLEQLEAALTSWPMYWLPRVWSRHAAGIERVVAAHGARLHACDEAALRERVEALRDVLRLSGFRADAVARAFALVRECAERSIGLRHYDVQLRGGVQLLHGRVAEMETGEGKTLTATLAAATAGLAGIPVHVVTVNDYLAARDADAMGPLYRFLGLSVGTIVHGMTPAERRAAYACDIVYASNKEIAFDYLRDRLALGGRPGNIRLKLVRLGDGTPGRDDKPVMRGLHFAIVDEADSILIDEARTPLIISRETDAADEHHWAEQAFGLADELEPETHYRVLRDERRVELTEPGRERLAVAGERRGGVWLSRIRREEAARQALAARHLYAAGEHYLVRDGAVAIVDEYTGRIMADRSWGEGLHQLIEHKEGCTVTGRKVPIARMTYQRFFRRYRRLAGMTGTAAEAARELWGVYGLSVARIPTNRPLRRRRLCPRVYVSADAKWNAVAARAAELAASGRPVLIGTRSVAASETVSARLTAAGLEHVVLSAAQDRDEAGIIARAGQPGRVTVATNMAGRGVDIRLAAGVDALGGLHVILTERHDAGRIDRQLEGRCGRQGDPGTTEAILSLEDPLLEPLQGSLLHRLAGAGGALARAAATLVFRRAQRRAERTHSRARRALMKADRSVGTLLAFTGTPE